MKRLPSDLKIPRYPFRGTPLQTTYTMAEEAIKTYRGNCHCASFVFGVKYPEIKKFQGCTCSRCHKSAYLFARLKNEDDLVFERGTIDELSSYRFGPKNVEHLVSIVAPRLVGRRTSGKHADS